MKLWHKIASTLSCFLRRLINATSELAVNNLRASTMGYSCQPVAGEFDYCRRSMKSTETGGESTEQKQSQVAEYSEQVPVIGAGQITVRICKNLFDLWIPNRFARQSEKYDELWWSSA